MLTTACRKYVRPVALPWMIGVRSRLMSAEDVEVAKRFRAASRAAVETGDREDFYALFADARPI
jgi:hypothetical protein